jgi:serine/threonine-protein kinase
VIIGSQFYMSPEQIFHPGHIDERTDIYSFGVVCYELLYGHHPKNIDRNTPDVLKRIAMEKPVRRTPPPGFEKLNEIIFTCMADLKKRYQTMQAVLDDLREFCSKFE